MTHTTDLYFEAHVTIDPVYNRMEVVKSLADSHDFRVAELFKANDQRSDKDCFMSARGIDYDRILSNTEALVDDLMKHGYNVRRYKIENTLLDVKF